MVETPQKKKADVPAVVAPAVAVAAESLSQKEKAAESTAQVELQKKKDAEAAADIELRKKKQIDLDAASTGLENAASPKRNPELDPRLDEALALLARRDAHRENRVDRVLKPIPAFSATDSSDSDTEKRPRKRAKSR